MSDWSMLSGANLIYCARFWDNEFKKKFPRAVLLLTQGDEDLGYDDLY